MFITHFFYCPFCKNENHLKIDVPDRGEYQKKHGNEVDFCCNSCHKKDKLNINRVFAKPNNKIMLMIVFVSVLIFIIGALAFLIFYFKFSFYFLFIFSIPILFYSYLNSISSNFNKYRIK